MDSTTLNTTIGLEIHVQLKTKSKMFCRCDNQSFAEATDGKRSLSKAPNTVVCAVCLGMPGVLPVANEQAILWTIKTGLALNCDIPKIAKFDRKHYFYPDLPKGYQISQYDMPFCVGGYVELPDVISNGNEKSHEISRLDKSMARNDSTGRIRLTRVHLEEDAGKLIHPSRDRAETSSNISLVDLNRAGTPLMEIVTEPDISSPEEAGDFMRQLQKIVRDVVSVSEASMEKGHLRCDANISISQRSKIKNQNDKSNIKMSKIIEIKNLNSFRFVEKALALAEQKLKAESGDWPQKLTKETWGYDSKKNQIFIQRQKEEASDYRYFPEPDLPPFDTSTIDLEILKSEIGKNDQQKIDEYLHLGIEKADAAVFASNPDKNQLFNKILPEIEKGSETILAKAIVNNYFGFEFIDSDFQKSHEYGLAIDELAKKTISKQIFQKIVTRIYEQNQTFDQTFSQFSGDDEKIDIEAIISKIIDENPTEVAAYKSGKKQLLSFFIGQVLKETAGRADPKEVSDVLKKRLTE